MKILRKHYTFIEEARCRGERFVIFQGGRRSGKTTSILQYIHLHLLQHPHTQAIIVTNTFARLRDSILSDLHSIFEENRRTQKLYAGTAPSVLYYNGSTITFTYADRDTRGYTSNKHFIFFNEAIQYKEHIARDLLKAATTGATVFFDYNPYTRFWVNERYETERNKLITTWRDNPFLSEFVQAEMLRIEEEGRHAAPGTMERYLYEVECLGIDSTLSGLCFPHTTALPVDEYFTCPVPEILAADWGVSGTRGDPDVLIGVKIMPDSIYMHEYYYSNEGGDDAFAAAMQLPTFRRQPFIFDTATGGRQRIEGLFARTGLRFKYMPASKGAGSVLIGIRNLQPYKIYITTTSRNLLQEAAQYRYEEKNGLLAPIDAYNHGFDCLRYAFTYYATRPKKGGPGGTHQ